MKRGSKRALLVGVTALLAAATALFVAPWSRPCDEEIVRAVAAWDAYAEVAPDDRRPRVLAVRDEIASGPSGALERAESVLVSPAGPDARDAARYREAMERLVLADGACR